MGAALLDKLKIRPFEYKMHILNILDHGEVFPAKVLSITHDSILTAFGNHAQNVACASMASGFGFKEADKLANAAASGPAASAPAAGGKAAAAKVEVKEEEPEEDIDMGGMFGDEY